MGVVVVQKAGVTDIVRVCEPTYSAEEVVKQGIQMHELAFDDGQSPPDAVRTMPRPPKLPCPRAVTLFTLTHASSWWSFVACVCVVRD